MTRSQTHSEGGLSGSKRACWTGSLRWVTFNGKRFDAPLLTAGTAAAGLTPTRTDLIKTYPFRHSSHADLMTLWQEPNYSLEGLSNFSGADRKEPPADGSEPPTD
jgi:hypothetical protein